MLQEYCPDVEVLAICHDVPAGALAINKYQPDVVFLDIEMPNYSGFELLGFFSEINFEIIFITAYSQYAVKAFEASAVDYILKPVMIDKLESAVEKLKTRLEASDAMQRIRTLKDNFAEDRIQKIAVPVLDGMIFLRIALISHINAEGSYARILLTDGSNVLVSKKLKYFESILNNHPNFFRVHRSHLINIDCVNKYSRNQSSLTMENGQEISIARDKRADFEKLTL